MDLRQLRYFVAIVESGSISRASFQLNIAQPALSLHIRNMEAELDMPLLHRTPQGVRPTEAGTILLRNARVIVERFEQTRREIKDSMVEPIGEVRLGLPGTISQILGVPLIMAARDRYPKIRLRIAEAMSGYVLEWLRLGRVDLALLFQAVEERGLHSEEVMSESLVLFGPSDGPTDPLPEPDQVIPFQAITALPLILPSLGHGLRDLLAGVAAREGVRLTADIEIDSYPAIKTLVERRLGYSILPTQAVRQEAAQGRLRYWQFDPPLMRAVHLAQPIDRPLSHAAKAIEQLCRATLRDLVRSGGWQGALMNGA